MEQEGTTDQSAFEGLYGRALKPTGTFADALRVAGYDPDKPLARYPTRVWLACLGVSHRNVLPHLTAAEAYRELGKRFIEAFYASTILGTVMRAGMHIIGPLRVLQKLPRNYAMVRTGVAVTVHVESPTSVKVHFEDRWAEPEFTWGVFTAAARFTSAKNVQVTLFDRTPDDFWLRVTWK